VPDTLLSKPAQSDKEFFVTLTPDAADLMENIGVASPPEVADYMNRESVKLFSL